MTRVPPRPEIAANVGFAGATGDHVGSMQADQFQTHQHSLGAFTYGQIKAECGNGCGALLNRGRGDTTTPVSGRNGTETRPSNVHVMYFMYVGNPHRLSNLRREICQTRLRDPARFSATKMPKESAGSRWRMESGTCTVLQGRSIRKL